MRVIVSPTGKRIVVAGLSPKSLAQSIGMSDASAANLLAGKQVSHYKLEEMQRERMPMTIAYRLTDKGQEYIAQSNSGLALLLSQLKGKTEASELSRIMIEEQHRAKYTRKRIQQDMAGAVKRGLVEQETVSGAIY